MNDNDKHIVKEKDGWYFWDEVGQDKYGPYKDIMNMASLERQLMDSFKDMDTKEKEQKDAAQMMTKEQTEHEEKINKRWAVKFGPKFKKKRKNRSKMVKANRRANR